MCGRDCKCRANLAYSGPGERPGVYVYPADVKTNPKTALELANADDEDD